MRRERCGAVPCPRSPAAGRGRACRARRTARAAPSRAAARTAGAFQLSAARSARYDARRVVHGTPWCSRVALQGCSSEVSEAGRSGAEQQRGAAAVDLPALAVIAWRTHQVEHDGRLIRQRRRRPQELLVRGCRRIPYRVGSVGLSGERRIAAMRNDYSPAQISSSGGRVCACLCTRARARACACMRKSV